MTDTGTEPKIFNDNGDIDWEVAFKVFESNKPIEETEKKLDMFKCKKCNVLFYCKNYHGKFPLCNTHKRKEQV